MVITSYYETGAKHGNPQSMNNYANILSGEDRRKWLELAASG